MTRRELASAIEQLAESTVALDHLLQLSPRDVERLLDLLSSDSGVESLRMLLNTVRSLQEGRSRGSSKYRNASRSRSYASPSKRRRENPDVLFEESGEADLRSLLERVFSDRDRFPRLRDIADFAGQHLGVRVAPQKLNRQRYIARVAKSVESSPRAMRMARNRLTRLPPSEHDESYKLLYDYIRGRDRG